MLSPQEDDIIDYLEEKYGCHTFLLYGSRALGTSRPDSDWDILALNRGGRRIGCHDFLEGVGELNAYIYPEEWVTYNPRSPSPLYMPLSVFVRLRNAKVLIQELNWGTYLVQTAKSIYMQGPSAILQDDLDQMEHHLKNTLMESIFNEALDPAHRNLAMCRLMDFCFSMYFQSRKIWLPSEKEGFKQIKKNDERIYEQFIACEAKNCSKDQIRTLINSVFNKLE